MAPDANCKTHSFGSKLIIEAWLAAHLSAPYQNSFGKAIVKQQQQTLIIHRQARQGVIAVVIDGTVFERPPS
jgi:hypothetical protein